MLGVSTDSVEKLRNFGDRLGLPFLLASDATGTAVTPIWPCFGSENRPDRFVGRNRRNMTHNGRCGTSVAVKDRPGAPRLGFLARSLAQATPGPPCYPRRCRPYRHLVGRWRGFSGVLRRRWPLRDADTVRPAGISTPRTLAPWTLSQAYGACRRTWLLLTGCESRWTPAGQSRADGRRASQGSPQGGAMRAQARADGPLDRVKPCTMMAL